MPKPERWPTPICVQRILAHAGNMLRLAAPLGLGKPNGLLNVLDRCVAADRGLSLTCASGLRLPLLLRPTQVPMTEKRGDATARRLRCRAVMDDGVSFAPAFHTRIPA